jgi:hypothetical protein
MTDKTLTISDVVKFIESTLPDLDSMQLNDLAFILNELKYAVFAHRQAKASISEVVIETETYRLKRHLETAHKGLQQMNAKLLVIGEWRAPGAR